MCVLAYRNILLEIQYIPFIQPNTFAKKWEVMINRISTQRKRAMPFNWFMLCWNRINFEGRLLMSHSIYLDHVIQYVNDDLYSTWYIFKLVSHYFYSHMTQMKRLATTFIPHTSSNWNTRVVEKFIYFEKSNQPVKKALWENIQS